MSMSAGKSRTTTVMAAVAGIALIAAACSPSDKDQGGEPNSVPESVSLILRNDVDTFDPFKSTAESGAKQFFDAAYDTLVRVKGVDGAADVTGSMAESWEMQPQ